jgi:hypothetical protein
MGEATIKFDRLIPNVYYNNIADGLKMFVDCLGFVIDHDEIKSAQPFCVLNKDDLAILLFEHKPLAAEHKPEFRFVTKNIEAAYEKISKSHPEYLHPNLKELNLRLWGAKEFALRDEQVCIIIQQW